MEFVKDALANKYEILAEIGKGDSATVYRAIRRDSGNEVAVKVLSQDIIRDQDYTDRLHKRTRIVGRLSHPNIITIYEEGVEHDVHYVAMELLRGMDLKKRIAVHGTLSADELAELIVPVLNALGHAHNNGIVHKNIKCSNIFLHDDGRIILSSFGVPYQAKGTLPSFAKDSNRTFEYMSPEEATGKGVDARSDIYSIGVVMYYCLTGTFPFSGNDPLSTARMITSGNYMPASRLKQVPGWMGSIVDGCLQKEISKRVQSCEELLPFIKARPKVQQQTKPKPIEEEKIPPVKEPAGRVEETPQNLPETPPVQELTSHLEETITEAPAVQEPISNVEEMMTEVPPLAEHPQDVLETPPVQESTPHFEETITQSPADQEPAGHIEEATAEIPPVLESLDDVPEAPRVQEPVSHFEETITEAPPVQEPVGHVEETTEKTPAEPLRDVEGITETAPPVQEPPNHIDETPDKIFPLLEPLRHLEEMIAKASTVQERPGDVEETTAETLPVQEPVRQVEETTAKVPPIQEEISDVEEDITQVPPIQEPPRDVEETIEKTPTVSEQSHHAEEIAAEIPQAEEPPSPLEEAATETTPVQEPPSPVLELPQLETGEQAVRSAVGERKPKKGSKKILAGLVTFALLAVLGVVIMVVVRGNQAADTPGGRAPEHVGTAQEQNAGPAVSQPTDLKQTQTGEEKVKQETGVTPGNAEETKREEKNIAVHSEPAVKSKVGKENPKREVKPVIETVTVPDLTGNQLNVVKSILTLNGLKIGDVSTIPDPSNEGIVIRQLPKAGTRVNKGSLINLIAGAQTVTVPDLTGNQMNAARSFLTLNGLKVGTVSMIPDPSNEGIVIRQLPKAGTKVDKGSSINLIVGGK